MLTCPDFHDGGETIGIAINALPDAFPFAYLAHHFPPFLCSAAKVASARTAARRCASSVVRFVTIVPVVRVVSATTKIATCRWSMARSKCDGGGTGVVIAHRRSAGRRVRRRLG